MKYGYSSENKIQIQFLNFSKTIWMVKGIQYIKWQVVNGLRGRIHWLFLIYVCAFTSNPYTCQQRLHNLNTGISFFRIWHPRLRSLEFQQNQHVKKSYQSPVRFCPLGGYATNVLPLHIQKKRKPVVCGRRHDRLLLSERNYG